MTKGNSPLYVLEVVIDSGSHFSLETIGIYSSENEAVKAIQELPPETDRMIYNVSPLSDKRTDGSHNSGQYGHDGNVCHVRDA